MDKTINISQLNNVNAINQVRELNLDILVDLMGYTSTHRIELFKVEWLKSK